MSRSNLICVSFLRTWKGFWGLASKVGLQTCEKLVYTVYGVLNFGKLGRPDEGEEEEKSETERIKENILLGRVLGQRLEQIFCHDSAFKIQ